MFTGSITGTQFVSAITTVSNTDTGTLGDNTNALPTPPTATCDINLIIPSYRITLSTTTTVYLNVFAQFSAGTLKAYGRISATRVG